MTDRDAAIHLLMDSPAQVGRWCGFTRLTDSLHGEWMRQMLRLEQDMTILAHRGSYKTTCLTLVLTTLLCLRPSLSILFLRKTERDVAEILRQIDGLLHTEGMMHLTSCIYPSPVLPVRSTATALETNCYQSPRGTVQLIGQGIGGSLTGKHADIIFTDDIVNLSDRLFPAKRLHTKSIYQELQNIRNPGGIIINTGTPWHPDDAIGLMPHVQKYDCYQTGLLTQAQLDQLRASMAPCLFAANYELRHIASEDALFPTHPPFTDNSTLIRDGIAHVDAAYGGGDDTVLTLGKRCGDTIYVLGRLWHCHVDEVLPEINSLCNRFLCAPLYCEVNGDKGYLARELKNRGLMVRTYSEHTPKAIKIATHLRKWWPRIVFLRDSDPAYIRQILDYSPQASHDDAPDSAACLLRLLDKGFTA